MQLLGAFRDKLLALLAATLLWMLAKSMRWHLLGVLSNKDFFAKLKEPSIFIFWHNRQLLMAQIYRAQGGKVLGLSTIISRHRDGRLIAQTVRCMGITSVAGSSTRGGPMALRGLLRALQSGVHAAITPDGPKGPRYKLKDGVVQLAQISGAKIYPIAYDAQRKWVFKSWDGMILPKFFSPAVAYYGDPITIPRELSPDQVAHYQDEIERELNKVTELVENYTYA